MNCLSETNTKGRPNLIPQLKARKKLSRKTFQDILTPLRGLKLKTSENSRKQNFSLSLNFKI